MEHEDWDIAKGRTVRSFVGQEQVLENYWPVEVLEDKCGAMVEVSEEAGSVLFVQEFFNS